MKADATSKIIKPSRTTGIEWTEHTWNPFAGCSIHSDGCQNCYAMRQAFRIAEFGTAPHYSGLTKKTTQGRIVWTGQVARASDSGMRKPFSIRGNALVFVNSMSDFWHDGAEDSWRIEALKVMRDTPQHCYQVLTKRPENIVPFLHRTGEKIPENVWIGTTVEHGKTTHRIDTLRNVPAAVRFLSVEPLIGSLGAIDLTGIHWVITGGESGPGARLCQGEWVRQIYRQCQAQDVPMFHKQWGTYKSNPLVTEQGMTERDAERLDSHGKGGCLLDGKQIKDMPSIWHRA